MDEAWLYEAFRRTRKDGVPGVDGQTADSYAEDLANNLRSLRDRAKSGTYWAPPVRRAQTPKGDGKETRTLGIPTFEDKILQRAVAMVLEAVYERVFHEGSFGFRPGRWAHQALQATREPLMDMGGSWVVEVDIRKFFDEVDHSQLRAILRRRVLSVLGKRFARYGLRLHPDKTRLVAFQRPSKGAKRPRSKPGTFDLLGFTHYWGRSRRGNWVIRRKTAKDRQRRALKALNRWCRANRHRPVPAQWAALTRKLRGLYAYYGIIGNVAALQSVRFQTCRVWRKWLNRRSQKGRMSWDRFNQLLVAFPLPRARRMAAV